MTTYTITTPTNIDSLTAKTGGDIYNVNGGILTIDQDSRYGRNQTTSASLAAMTISATLGGIISIDSRYVRLIPFNNGTGNVPVSNTVISQGGVTSKLIGVWSAINAAPIASGSAMPTSGFIKVKQISQVPGFSAGALTGILAAATGADIAGWIEIVGDQSATCTVPRLGKFEIKGDWFEVGTTTGNSATTYQVPTNGNALPSGSYLPGVYVHNGEAGDTDANYEFYPSVGVCTGADCISTDVVRGKLCWINSAGLVQFGTDALNGGANLVGYIPPAGRKIRIGNVILHSCVTTTRTINALPHSTLGTRYDFSTSGGGAIDIDKAMSAWYLAFSYTNSCLINCTGTFEQFYFNLPGAAPILTRCGVGSAATAVQSALISNASFNGLTASDCVFAGIGGGGSVARLNLTDTTGARLTNIRSYFHTSYLSGQHSLLLLRSTDLIVDGFTFGNGGIQGTYCSDVILRNLIPYGLQGSLTRTGTSVVLSSGMTNILIDGVYPVDANSFPLAEIFGVGSYGAANLTLRNVGTLEAPANLGGVAELTNLNASNAQNIKIQRCWLTNTPTSNVLSGGTTTHDGVRYENIYDTSYKSAIYSPASNRMRWRGVTMTSLGISVSTLRYGNYWQDYFTAETTGIIRVDMCEPDASLIPYITLSGSAAYTGTGGLYMPKIGDEVILEMDYYMLGYTALRNQAPVMGGGTIGNYALTYQIDVNDGNGWNGTWKALNTTNLTTETLDYTKGFKLKVKITTTTTNTTAITSLVIYTSTTADAQKILYPLGAISITFIDIKADTEIRIFNALGFEVAGVESCIADQTLIWNADNEGVFTIRLISLVYGLQEFTYTATVGEHSIPIQQEIDPWFKDPV